MTLPEAIILALAIIVWRQDRAIRKLQAETAGAVALGLHAHKRMNEIEETEEVEVEVEEACGCERCLRVERGRWN